MRGIMICEKCQIAKTRKNIVESEFVGPYIGMIVAEAPTKREDRTGKFTDPYWQVIKEIMISFNQKIENYFITAVIKCYPGSNRYPEPHEIQNCSTHFSLEVQKIQPKAILFLSEHCAKEYIKEDIIVNHRYETSFCKNVVVTYNPKAVIVDSDEYMKLKSVIRKFISICIA